MISLSDRFVENSVDTSTLSEDNKLIETSQKFYFLIEYYIDFMDIFISCKCLVKLMFDLSRLMLNFFLIKENSTDDKEALISK